jgi:hypothetical protein
MEEVRGGAPTRKGGGDRFVAISRAPEVIILTLTLYFLRACSVGIIMPVCSFSISEFLISFQANILQYRREFNNSYRSEIRSDGIFDAVNVLLKRLVS